MPHDHHDHDHLSPSGHPYRQDNDAPLTYFQRMEIAVRELLTEKGHLTPAEIATQIDPLSIMMYPIPDKWTKGDFQTSLNSQLSPTDRALIRQVYPSI